LRRPPAPIRHPLRTLALTGAAAASVLAVFAPSASAHLLTLQSGSPNTNKISDLYTITLVIAIVIFLIVEGTLFYSLVRFRKRKGRVAAQIHGNTRLEIGWTVGATVILIGLATLTFAELSSIRNPPNSPSGGLNLRSGSQFITDGAETPPNHRAISIQVNGQQYLWRFTYLQYGTQPDGLDDPYTYYELVVPVDTDVRLKVVSDDVTHSFWIPDLVPKVQAVPGYTNYQWFIAPHVGHYFGQCAFLCGEGHARMKAEITAVTPTQFKAWIKHQQYEIAQANADQQKARAAAQNEQLPSGVEVK
jgi:cytochrome c oxidase subunit II